MVTKRLVRNYRCSDAAFIKVADGMLLTAWRDKEELAEFGVAEEWLHEIAAANEAFKQSMPDYFVTGIAKMKSSTKNETRKIILQISQHIVGIASGLFGEGGGPFVFFRSGALSRLPDEDLMRRARGIANAAERYATELASEGIGPELVAEYRAHLVSFNHQLDVQYRRPLLRKCATQERIALGNVVYKHLVTLSGKGKICWKNKNYVKYKQYVLFPKKTKVAE